jgi:hypothetical protein
MDVRIDHGKDKQTLAKMFLEQLPRRADRFHGYQWIEDDPASPAPQRELFPPYMKLDQKRPRMPRELVRAWFNDPQGEWRRFWYES